MNQVPGQQAPGGASVRRRWWWQRQLWKPETQAALLPPVGTTVGGYHLEAKLGRGGQGTVYRARRGGQLYAVKFIYLPLAGKWSRRELEVLPRLERVGVVRLEGHGKWPDLCPFFLFIAMEYVPGLALYAWARRHRPTARQVAYSGEVEHSFRAKWNTRSGHVEQSERQRRWPGFTSPPSWTGSNSFPGRAPSRP